jgi:hypothetical protein
LVRRPKQPAKANAWVYGVPGLTGTVRIVKTLLTGPAPETLTLRGVTFAAPAPRLTPEERKAARAAMTPAEKLAAERLRVQKAQARLARMEKQAAK